MKLKVGDTVEVSYGATWLTGSFCYYFGKNHAMVKTKYGAEMIVPLKYMRGL